MKRLLLLRHAKSSWNHPGLDDFERPLSGRGREDAPDVGRYLRQHALVPDHTICSPARRTEQTWTAVAEHLDGGGSVDFDSALYLAPPSTYLTLAQSQPLDVNTLLLIGHNPGIEQAALRLSGLGAETDLVRLRTKVPTASLIEIQFDVERWGEIDWRGGRLMRFVTPADL